MRRVELEALGKHGGARFAVGPDQVSWRFGRHLVGCTFARRLSPSAVESFASLVATVLPQGTAPHQVVLDLRLVAGGVDAMLLRVFDKTLLEAMVHRGRQGDRLALVTGNDLEQVTILGHMVLAGGGIAWARYASVAESFAALGRRQSARDAETLAGAITGELVGDQQVLQRVRRLIGEAPRASLGEVAAGLGLTPRSLQRALRIEGTTFADERSDVRMQLASALLVESAFKVGAVAEMVGFESIPHFITTFTAHFGQTPARWRQTRPANPSA